MAQPAKALPSVISQFETNLRTWAHLGIRHQTCCKLQQCVRVDTHHNLKMESSLFGPEIDRKFFSEFCAVRKSFCGIGLCGAVLG